VRDSGVLRLATKCDGRQRGWPTPEALVHRGEVRHGGKLGGKPRGGGAHRGAEVVVMVAPNQVGWHAVQCPIPVT
jgi:hypothetical protein